VPLSIAVSFQVGTHGFLRALLSKDLKKIFVLDPRSVLFQRDWNRSHVREPHKKMAAVFGEPFQSIGIKQALQTSDLSEERAVAVTKACIEYQQKFRVLAEAEKKLKKYAKLLGADVLPPISNPQWFIPPYFLFTDQNDPWYAWNLQCAKAAVSIVGSQDLVPVLHFQKWGGGKDWKGLLAPYAALGINKVFVYPNDFHEHDAPLDELKAYAMAIRSADSIGMESYALHGGYFAVALQKRGLKGFGNGVGYGEWRDSSYHRGGTALARIYMPKLHRFLDPAVAQNLVDKDPTYFGVDSEFLEERVSTGRPLVDVSTTEALEHFMECRDAEISSVESSSLQGVVDALSATIARLEQIGGLEEQRYSPSLKVWRSALAADPQ
jgi:hypothetical protein